jgi:hypothetical protein
MWKTALSYALSMTNYSVTNINNLYNFILSIMDLLTEEQNQKLIDSLILHLGRSFYKDFRTYIINKIPNSQHLSVINRIV